MKDKILNELWRIKDQLAEENGNDLNKLYKYLLEKQKLSLKKTVNREFALKNKQSVTTIGVAD